MRRNRTAGLLILRGIALASGLLGMHSSAVRADVPLNGVSVIYHGGALIQHVRVAPLLYGSSWEGDPAPAYLNGFLQALFADGRFMANLDQYADAGFQIGNGSASDPVVDPAELPKVGAALAAPGIRYQVTDAQIRAEIKAQVAAGKLPPPDENMLYVVCTQYDVAVQNGKADSEHDFDAYHEYDRSNGFAYAVIAPTGYDPSQRVNTPAGYESSLFIRTLTAGISHELAEAVTDPQPALQLTLRGGWYDENQFFGGEIGDIPTTLWELGFITDDQFFDLLTGPDGTVYAVQKVWSNQDKAPVAFATSLQG